MKPLTDAQMGQYWGRPSGQWSMGLPAPQLPPWHPDSAAQRANRDLQAAMNGLGQAFVDYGRAKRAGYL